MNLVSLIIKIKNLNSFVTQYNILKILSYRDINPRSNIKLLVVKLTIVNDCDHDIWNLKVDNEK